MNRDTQFKFISNKNNDLIVTGFVINDESQISNIWYQKIDGFSKELVISKQIEFDGKFKKEFVEEKKSIDYNFTANNYYITDSNHLYLLSEEHYITERTVGTTAVTSYSHTYGDILLFDIDDSGKLVYAGGIQKKNRVTAYRSESSLPIEMRNKGLSSSFLSKNDLIILFPADNALSSYHYYTGCDSIAKTTFKIALPDGWTSNTKDFNTTKTSLIVPMNGASGYRFSINKF